MLKVKLYPKHIAQSESRNVYGKSFLQSAKDCHTQSASIPYCAITTLEQYKLINQYRDWDIQKFNMSGIEHSIYFLLLIAADLGEI